MKTFFKIISIFLIWRVLLLIVSYYSGNFLAYDPSFPYSDGLLDTFDLPQWLYSWANFDGVHYITIANHGYKIADLIQAFFPAYPLLMRLFSIFTGDVLSSGLLISNLSFIALLFTWFIFMRENYSKITWTSMAVLLLFPTSFFFGAVYTESFFLLLVLLSFILVQKKKYLLAAISVAMASATKIVGIALVPALLFEIIFSDIRLTSNLELLKNKSISKLKKWQSYLKPSLIISLGSIGLLLYMNYLYREFDDPLYFFHVQSEFGGIRQESIVAYPQVLFRYLKILLTVRPFDLKYFSYLQDFVVATAGLAVIIYSASKVRLSYVVFSLLAFILPTLTGTFSSMPRYILLCFPIYIILATWIQKNKLFKYAWFIFSGFLLAFNTILFIQGYWVA